MAVVLANCALTARVRKHPFTRDAHGTPVPTGDAEIIERGPHPGAAMRQPDDSWNLRLDPRAWEVRAGDEVTDGTRVWVLTGTPRLHAVPGHSAADYVQATATLNPPQVP